MRARAKIALTIAGSDSSAGAGIQADLKTFAALGVYGASAITALTAQNTQGVTAVQLVAPEIIKQQIEAVFIDMNVAAVKIGMLGSGAIAGVTASCLAKFAQIQGGCDGLCKPFVVYDPVLVASTGDSLAAAGLVEAIKTQLLPLVDCLTPNLSEAAALLGIHAAESEAEMTEQGFALLKLGSRAVLVKGGHLAGGHATDLLISTDGAQRFSAPRIQSHNLHGTGCTLSSAIAAHMILGASLPQAVAAAKQFVRRSIDAGRDFSLGRGPGPLVQLPWLKSSFQD